jgi:hypothetical protein
MTCWMQATSAQNQDSAVPRLESRPPPSVYVVKSRFHPGVVGREVVDSKLNQDAVCKQVCRQANCKPSASEVMLSPS